MHSLRLELPILVGRIEVNDIRVSRDTAAFEQLRACGQRYAKEFADTPISTVPGVQVARQLFRTLGIEPTKHRPASEALLRRFLKGKTVHPINNVVDVSNWCALDFLLPNGIYDRRKLSGDIVLRKGLPGESYTGLNNRAVNLENRYTLADASGPFGSPKTDSQRSCVDLVTTDLIAIVYTPEDYDPRLLLEQCHLYAEWIVKFCGGVVESCRILEAAG